MMYNTNKQFCIKNRGVLTMACSDRIHEAEHPLRFEGKLRKLRIVSNNICFGSMPEPDKEVEQHLTVNRDGCVRLSRHFFGRSKKPLMNNFNIENKKAADLLDKIGKYFNDEYVEISVTDVGVWELELTNTEGEVYKFCGSLWADDESDYTYLSDLVREAVGMYDLFVFDGNSRADVINKITVEHSVFAEYAPLQKTEGKNWAILAWNRSDRLIIDRKAESIEYIRKFEKGCTVTHRYEIKDGVKKFLDSFDAEDLFSHIEGEPDDVVETANNTRNYTITIEYEKAPARTITGNFNKYGLPDDFGEFAKMTAMFMSSYGYCEMLDPSVYGRVNRRKSDLIYCSVTFEDDGKSYYYLTDDDSIKVGDKVIVPAGIDNHEAIVEVVDIEYFSKENVPFPLEKTKRIIRKWTDEGFKAVTNTD